jgi:hypothetical protein
MGEQVTTKLMARVGRVLRPGINKIGTIVDGKMLPVAELPLPSRVEIELKGGRNEPCMMLRYTDADEFCGDTWHETLKDALSQAEYEYGLVESDFKEVLESS